MSCLIIKNDGIGDLILASGLIASLGEEFGGKVDLVTCSSNREVAESISPLRNRYYVSRDGLQYSKKAMRLGYLWPKISKNDKLALNSIRSQKYNTAICLRRYIRQSSLIIMQNVQAHRKVAMWQIPTNISYQLAIKASKGWNLYEGSEEPLSELSYAQSVLESEFSKEFDPLPKLGFCHKQTSIPYQKNIAFGIGGNTQNWPIGNWIELASLLASDGWGLVLLGGADEQELGNQIQMKVPNCRNLVGKKSLEEAAEILRGCDAYIGNDTGLTHLASLVVIKCLIIMSGTTFRRFLPWPESTNQTVIYHGMDCFDCDTKCRFSERYCLSHIRPYQILEAFNEIIKSKGDAIKEINLNENAHSYNVSWRRIGSRIPTHF